tara:strand:- start:846 stop:1115 length:270 start_codon:yes stop_codon:yes gene_type:complete
MKKIFFIAFFTLISFNSFANNKTKLVVFETTEAPRKCVINSKREFICSQPLYYVTFFYVNIKGETKTGRKITSKNYKSGDIIETDKVFL